MFFLIQVLLFFFAVQPWHGKIILRFTISAAKHKIITDTEKKTLNIKEF